MKVTWLGQAGLLFESDNVKIMIDPYLSDSCGEVNPSSKRREPVDEKIFDIKPDVIILTHDHLDHTDEKTLTHFLNDESSVLVLASKNSWQHVRTVFGGNNNYVMFNRGTVWTFKDIQFTAVKAEHSDDFAIGVIIDDGNKKYYITGDTLFNKSILEDIPPDIDTVFLPVNGKGNNMNFDDASCFAFLVNARHSVPMHFGMFDSLNPELFKADNRVIPHIFREVEL